MLISYGWKKGSELTWRYCFEKRGSIEVIKQYRQIMQVVRNSPVINRQWDDYRKDFDYAAGSRFEETCDTVIAIMDKVI